jgi:fibronectin type 3 domain-containing protein
MNRITIIAVVALVMFQGCLDDIEETPLVIQDEDLQAPVNINVISEDNSITLSWPAVTEAEGYRLYRSSTLGESWSRISETTDTFYVDAEVANGRQYLYSVSSVGASGVESARSSPVEAVPSVYSILINGGSLYAGSRDVVLYLTAPATTHLMKIGNQADLSGETWESFAYSRSWLLEEGDGVKEVYAAFQDINGTLSPVTSQSIELDTYSMIESITITPTPHVYSPGSGVHLAMEVEGDETGGEGTLSLEGMEENVTLRDDGRGGDSTAGDGRYEADFGLPTYLRGNDMTVSGVFTDRAGNMSPNFEAEDKISFTDPPEAVRLIGSIDSTTSMITIRWEESSETHFLAYKIYRDTEPGVSDDPSLFIRGLDNIGQTSYPDTEVEEGKTYYYRIFVLNDLEESAGSNEIMASTLDAYPNPVILDDPSAVGATRLTLTWTQNMDSDFLHYRIFRSTSPGVTEASDLLDTITEREVTYFDDAGIDTTSYSYYYRIVVYDEGGKSSRSNEVTTRP